MVARMNSRVLSIVTSLVGAWTAIYTTGMPRTLRETRRNEIASDLWECCANVARGGQSVRHAAAEVLARLFLGIPDDIFWKWENEMNTASTNGHVALDKYYGIGNGTANRLRRVDGFCHVAVTVQFTSHQYIARTGHFIYSLG